MEKSKSDFKMLRSNFFTAISLAVVFGLGWGFGLLSTRYSSNVVSITFQVLFSITVAAQGGLLFVFHGVRNPDARRAWKRSVQRLTSITTGIKATSSSKSTTNMLEPPSSSQNMDDTVNLSQVKKEKLQSVSDETIDNSEYTKIDITA